ncbi:2'-5' RNA ligase family protein [Microbacterium amylolyticum]|uniref:DUF1868 domain-containing protein n=1 Tax=Microbacterium amylolyticum TaxID=936337 RepID=A0ABS4ZIN9_9MICO|nr:2'-5' RNA ligase family protein [Microbacterium amylolyticum]MBP2436351.1 hypothetical protein [Microbacterium amylolyticum]
MPESNGGRNAGLVNPDERIASDESTRKVFGMVRAFMTDPSLLDSLNGQQYLVVRPAGKVASFYETEQESLLSVLPGSVSFPNTGHVTLRGFYEPERVDALRELLVRWASEQPAIRLQVEGVDGFPPPFQVLIARLQRTPSLIEAYASLTAALDATDFYRIGELTLDEWVFHLSLVYASTLSEPDWEKAHEVSRRELDPAPAEVCATVEFVWYENGIERSERLMLGGVAAEEATGR